MISLLYKILMLPITQDVIEELVIWGMGRLEKRTTSPVTKELLDIVKRGIKGA